jgi:hypothetical protein
MPPLIRALRPQEWVKNLLVFAGVLFSGRLDEGSLVLDAVLAFAAFCAISSAGYLLNDLCDREHDRRHPEKRHRPIASGAISTTRAGVVAVVLTALAIGLAFATGTAEVAGLVALYGVIAAAYSLRLKRLVIIDVMTIGSLFILRVIAGAVAVGAQASEFLLVCTGFLALFLGFTKRRQEAILEQLPVASYTSNPAPANPGPALVERPLAEPGSAEPAPADAESGERSEAEQVTRPVLEHYSIPFLDQMVAMVTASAIISYVIYAVNSPNVGSKMLATAPSVLYGILRYLYLIYDRRDTRSTAAILTEDPGMLFAGVSWLVAAFLALYVFD